MNEEDVARLAAAIATVNGHNDVAAWAVKVVEAWKAVGAPPAAEASQEGSNDVGS